MIKLKIALLMLFVVVTGCRTKYDISKAVEILPSSNENQVDYKLRDIQFALDDDKLLVKTEGKTKEYMSIPFSGKESVYANGIVYILSKNYLGSAKIDSKKTDYAQHKIKDPYLAITSNSAIVYNEKEFTVFDTETFEVSWKDNINEDGLASRFACNDDISSCFALSLSGSIIKLDLSQQTLQTVQALPKQDMILNALYAPAVYKNYIIFASGNSEFAIFDTTQNKIVTSMPFVDSDSSSIFDINLVKEIYATQNNIIISHINGLYAFNILYGRPLWEKKIVSLGNIGFLGQYTVLCDKSTKNIVMMHTETGGLKWVTQSNINPTAVFADYNRNIVIFADDGIHLFDSQTGEEQENRNLKSNSGNAQYVFTENNNLYWVKGSKIYTLK